MKATAFNWFCLAGISLIAIYTPQAGVTYKHFDDQHGKRTVPGKPQSDCFPVPKKKDIINLNLFPENDKSNTMQAPATDP